MLRTPIPYCPKFYVDLPKVADVASAWRGIDRILYDIVCRFNIQQEHALEFGVEHGYSTSALANVFKKVTGVDTFCGDQHSGYKADHFVASRNTLQQWPNVVLSQARYQDWIKFDEGFYDLIHVDIEHNYHDTYVCGHWAVLHAPVVIFHDTESFREVQDAVRHLAYDTNRIFYNFQPCHGLGILVKQ